MIGFKTRTNTESRTAIQSSSASWPRSTLEPRSMKKNSSRKSRIVTSREPIASRYGVDAIETPPRNAPTSTPKPSSSPSAPSATAHAIANRTRRSGSRARAWSSGVRAHRISTARTASSAMPFARTPSSAAPVEPSDSPLAVRAIITTTTTRSWTIRIPTARRPWRSSSSRRSERSLITMIVLERARPIPTYSAGVTSSPSASARRKPPAAVSATWAPPTASETGPSVRITWMSSFSPTTKRSRAMPSCARSSSSPPGWTRSAALGPATTPTATYAITSGSRSQTAIVPATAETTRIAATWTNRSSVRPRAASVSNVQPSISEPVPAVTVSDTSIVRPRARTPRPGRCAP